MSSGYEAFAEAIETLGIMTRVSHTDLKRIYKELAHTHHPDHGGDVAHFQRIVEAYELIDGYMRGYRFDLSQEEFEHQHPLFWRVGV